MEKLKVFITGHKGFLGKKLIKILETKKNIDILIFDGDLLNIRLLEDFFIQNNPDIVIHLAGAFSSDFRILLESNVETTNTIALLSKKYSVKKIVFSSSGAVYGDYKKTPYQETDLLQPIDLYGLSKKMAEEVLQIYTRDGIITHIILRFPNIYSTIGEGKGVIAKFLEAIKSEGVITIFGTGEQRRDFLHVNDACNAILQCIEYEKSDIFNISSQVNLSINELVKILQQKFTFKILNKKSTNPLSNLSLDYSKSIKKLGFRNQIDILKI